MLSSNRKREGPVRKLSLIVFLLIVTACQSPTARVAGGLGNLADNQNYCNTAVQLSVLEKGGVSQICYNSRLKILEFSLLNTANADIAAADIQVYTPGGVFPLERVLSKEPGIIFSGRAYFDDQFGRIQKVRFIPTILIDDREFACPNKALSVDEISDC